MQVQVPTIRLDTFLQTHATHLPLTIKIDVEDFEAQVLEGACSTLANHYPIIICEILPRSHGNLATYDFLTQHAYSIFAIASDGLFRMLRDDMGRARHFTNFVLLPKARVPDNQNYIPEDKICDICTLRS